MTGDPRALLPLVEPAGELTVPELRRYSRHVIIPGVGTAGQRRLKAARVLVVGAGGLGSPVLAYLAAAGVGTIGILDDDVVEESNLQRQVVHGQDDLGRSKVESARDRVHQTNPFVTVAPHPIRLDATNALELLGGYDLVVDGTDNFATRYLVGDACELLGLPCVWGSIFRFDGQASLFWAAPRWADGGAEPGVVYRDLFPQPPPPGAVPSCAEGGVLGVLCAAVGAVMATEAVKLICGIGEPLLGRLLVFDALEMSWRTLRVRPEPRREPVTALVDYEAFCGVPLRAGTGAGDTIGASDLAGLLDARERGEADLLLVDVREPGEREIAAIPGSELIPIGQFRTGEALAGLAVRAGGRRVVLYCKSGVRSGEALELMRAAGHADAVHLDGGILAWIRDVDPTLPAY